MHTNQRAGAFAIQIKISDMKLSTRSLQFRFVRAVNRASQTKLRIVRDVQRIVVILSLDDRQHWSKDLFLLDRVRPVYVSDHGRLDEESLLAV